MTELDMTVEVPEGPVFTLPTCFPPSHGIRGEDGRVTYRAETAALIDGYRNLLVDVTVPAHTDGERVPVVVWIHGGGFRMGASEEVWSPWFHTMQEKVLAAGFAFAALTYRFSAEAIFPAQLLDVRAGLRYVRHYASIFGIDPARAGLWGGSAGAQLSLLLALTPGRDFGGSVGVAGADEPVGAVVDFFGLADIIGLPDAEQDGLRAGLLGGPVAENLELARAASPVTYLRGDAPPILAFHGTADGLIPIEQSRTFVARACEAGADAELVEVEGADHGFADIEMDGILDRSIAFLAEHLQAGSR